MISRLRDGFKLPQIIIIAYLLVLILLLRFTDISYIDLFNNSIVKFLMNGTLVLSLVPMINVGAGRNFGLPIGISAGLLSMCIAIEFKLTGLGGLFIAMGLAVVIGIIFGYVYSLILNKVKGDEEIIATFAGFCFIPLMSFFWTLAPFKNRQMLYPVGGKGLRPKINLENYFGKALDNLWSLQIGRLVIPLGSLVFFIFICILVKLIMESRLGHLMAAVEENQVFTSIVGVNGNSYRTLGIIMSTVLGAIGIIVYSQSYGFIHLYNGPFMMAFPAVSAILIGGSTKGRAGIFNVVVGTYLYQTTFLLSVPVSNALLLPEMSEVIRMIVTNGIILYAFLYEGGRRVEK